MTDPAAAPTGGTPCWASLLSSLLLPDTGRYRLTPAGPATEQTAGQRHRTVLYGYIPRNYDIFEGTEQIQQLVIARAITGLRIE